MSMKQTMCEFVHGMTCDDVCKFVGSIVRCRDCKHVYVEDGAIHRHWCDRKERGKQHSFVCHPDGFCAWGERRGDAE